MANDIDTVLVANLQRFIKAKGYSSVERFAYEHGLSKGGLGKILQGKRTPRFDTVVKIAKALEITLQDLYPLGDESQNEFISAKRLKLEKVKTAQKLLTEILEDIPGQISKRKKRGSKKSHL